MRTRHVVTAAGLLFGVGTAVLCLPHRATPVHAATDAASRAPAQVAVVELFTSEGCSSCPPADDLLRRIAGTTSANGQTIIALSEHVTYWNNLGWADPFSADTFTDRQSSYVSRLGAAEAYTPQAVVNGRAEFVGSDSRALGRVLQAEAQRPGLPLSITEVKRDGPALTVHVRAGSGQIEGRTELWAAVTDDTDESRVIRGENGGRTLRHAAVVRSMTRVGDVSTGGEQVFHVTLPSAVAAAPDKAHHVAMLAQRPGQGAIVGAALAAF